MKRPIQFSVPRWSIPWPNQEPDPQEDAFLAAIQDTDTAIELFDAHPYAPYIVRVKQTLDDRGIDIGTVHGGHLQRVMNEKHGVSNLMTQVRHLHLASVIDQTPEESLHPTVSTHHLPRFWIKDGADLDESRRTLLTTLERGLEALEPDSDRANLDSEVFDGGLITATVSLENVAPRGPHEYLLVTPADVNALVQTAMDLGVEDALAFTCDVGHTQRPVAMLRQMNPIENVHLHSTAPIGSSAADQIRKRYDISPEEPIGPEDRAGIAHHLPPHVGSLDLQELFDTLDDVGYTGPLTIELHDVYRTAEVVYESIDIIDRYQ